MEKSQTRPTAADDEASSAVKQIDREQALTRVGGDIDLLKEIAGMFLEESSIMLQTMERAVADSDAKALERSAHTFKGSVANFNAAHAFEAALALELIARGTDLAAAPGALARIRREFEKLRPELEALASE